MARAVFRAIKKPPPNFLNYLGKAFIALAVWLLFFSVVYVNTKLNIFLVANRFSYLLGEAFLLAILIVAGGAYLTLLDYKAFSKNSNLLLIATVIFLAMLLFEACLIMPLDIYIAPMAGISILLTLLLSLNASFVVTLILSLIFGVMIQGRMDLFFVIFLGGTIGAITIRNARRRNHLLNAGLFVGIFNLIIISCFGLFKGEAPILFLK